MFRPTPACMVKVFEVFPGVYRFVARVCDYVFESLRLSCQSSRFDFLGPHKLYYSNVGALNPQAAT